MVSTILLTEPVCNFKCEYCYYSHGNDLKNKGFNREATKENIRRDIELYGTREDALWFLLWGGEPTINRYFKEVVLMIREQNQDVGIFTSTNGSALTDDFISFCKTNKVKLAVSHDLIYQDVRKEGTSLHGTKYAEQVAKAIREGVVNVIQTVWSEDSWDIQAMYCYLNQFFKENSLEPIHWRINNYVAYSKEDVNKTIHSKRALASYKTWLVDNYTGKIKNPSSPDPQTRNNFLSLLDIAAGYQKLSWYDALLSTETNANNPTCKAYDLNNQHWNCKDTYMQNDCEHPIDVNHQYNRCFSTKCKYFMLCKGICSGKTDEHRALNCASIRAQIDTTIEAVREGFIECAQKECDPPVITISEKDGKTLLEVDGKGNFLDLYFCARNTIEEIHNEPAPSILGHSYEKHVSIELEDKYVQVIARTHNYANRFKPSDLVLKENF